MRLPPSLTPQALAQQLAVAVTTILIGVVADHVRERPRPRPRAPEAGGRLSVYIYGLADPRTKEVRYVGASVKGTQPC